MHTAVTWCDSTCKSQIPGHDTHNHVMRPNREGTLAGLRQFNSESSRQTARPSPYQAQSVLTGQHHREHWQAVITRTDQIQFPVVVQNSRDQLETITLIAVIGPGDDGLPVLTVMLPGED